MFFAGLGLGSVALISYTKGGYLDAFGLWGAIWAAFLIFISAFMAGSGLWAMHCAARAVWELGRRFGDSLFVTKGKFGVLSTGRVLAQCWAVIGGVWLVFSLSALFGPAQNHLSDLLLSYPVLIIAAPAFPLIVGCFFGGQYPMHEAMVNSKRREILHLEGMLRELTPEKVENLSQDRREVIEFLRRSLAEAESLPEWPFSNAALATIGGSLITSNLPLVFKAVTSMELFGQFQQMAG